MLAKQFRFHGLSALNYCYRKGKTIRGPKISLKFIKNERQSQFRAAVVVSKKVEKTATGRNRIRRRVYEQIRQYKDAINGPYDLIFSVFDPSAATVSSSELEKVIQQLLQEADVLK